MKFLKLSVFSLLCFFANLASAQDLPKSHLKVEQNKLVNSKGEAVVLTGFGLGGWLMPEGYMLGLPKPYDSPRRIRNAVVDLTDQATADKFFTLYEANYVSEDDIKAIASWGFNSLRVPFNADRIMPRDKQGKSAPYYFDPSGLALLDNVVAWASKYQLYVILDMHAAPGGQSAHNIADSDGVARLWHEPEVYWPQTIALWETLARRYKDNPWMIGYDVLNEPMLPGTEELGGDKFEQHDNMPLRELYMQISKALRNIDQGKKILFLEGGFWAQNMKDLLPAWDANTVYAFHAYPAPTSIEQLPASVKEVMAADHPVWFGEGGENWNKLAWQDWLAFNRKFTTMMERDMVGWSWWTTKKFARATQPWQCHHPQGFSVITTYLANRGPKPSKEFASDVLLKMVENLATEQCRLLPEFVESIGGKLPK
ncbi:cellulase family glycosylhydrolase [Thalassotalea sp. Y01]|uniref:glycoside hydrolase family 5 protein n=1 Tax=Thalassotalea sp. Y01 TaxID=2729613 RepID=UPI00145D023C|nr:cellulase family glycosylhydrolase [Thalassotalea sp. Y01]NMP16331.1 glycoside hydrolase family 5 protein [Thalassotalea sp. Y01]